jgi:DNA-binding MarR family transcriptional regulator
MTDDAGRELMRRIRVLVRRFSLAERADIACCGLTVAQAATLEVLQQEGEARLSTVARRLGIDNSTVTRNIGRLKDLELVETEAVPTDRRATVARLSDDGRRAVARVARIEADFARSITDDLGPEGTASTIETLDRLLGSVRSASESCCPGAFDHLMTFSQD